MGRENDEGIDGGKGGLGEKLGFSRGEGYLGEWRNTEPLYL